MTPEEKEMQDIEEIQMRCSKNIRECIEIFGQEKTFIALDLLQTSFSGFQLFYCTKRKEWISKEEFINEYPFIYEKLYKNSEIENDRKK